MTTKRTRAVAILINNNKILLLHRTHKGREFWVFPGGGVKDEEFLEDAVIRELKEETSIEGEIVKLLYKHTYPDIEHEQYFYLCEYVAGDPELGNYIEKKKMEEGKQTYDPRWVDIDGMSEMLIYPLEIRDWLISDISDGFTDTPKSLTIDTNDLRQ